MSEAREIADEPASSKPIQRKSNINAELISASRKWKRAGKGWRLFDGKRRMGDVMPDDKYPGMWRSGGAGDATD